MDKFKNKYFGSSKISSVEKIKEKTYLGNDKVSVSLSNGTKKVIPLEMLVNGATPEAGDATKLRNLICEPIASKLMSVLIDSEVILFDIHHVIRILGESVERSKDRANSKLWGKIVNVFEAPQDDRTLLDIEKVLTKDGKKK